MNDLKFAPGYEPEDVKASLSSFFGAVSDTFPDRIIYWSEWDHSWDKAANSLCHSLGYARGGDFLRAYGFTVVPERPAPENSAADDASSAKPDSETDPEESAPRKNRSSRKKAASAKKEDPGTSGTEESEPEKSAPAAVIPMQVFTGVPIWEKYTLTIQEAAEYFRIGENKLREIVKEHEDADFILWNGNRPQIKRKLFEQYVDTLKSV